MPSSCRQQTITKAEVDLDISHCIERHEAKWVYSVEFGNDWCKIVVNFVNVG